MSLDKLTDQVREIAEDNMKLGYVVKFIVDEGIIRWDGTGFRPEVDNEDGEVDTEIRMTSEDLKKMMSGTLSPSLAYMTGKLKVSGKVGVAMKIADLMED